MRKFNKVLSKVSVLVASFVLVVSCGDNGTSKDSTAMQDPTTIVIKGTMDAEHWTFLQGTESTVREFANVLAVKYKQISPLDFSHSNIISVFNDRGELMHQQEGLGVNNKETVSTILELLK